jgi:uncharacterized protein (DUF169 family)
MSQFRSRESLLALISRSQLEPSSVHHSKRTAQIAELTPDVILMPGSRVSIDMIAKQTHAAHFVDGDFVFHVLELGKRTPWLFAFVGYGRSVD